MKPITTARVSLLTALALCWPALSMADTISVVTSFPKELTAAYKKAYEAKYPNDKVEILNKNTAAGIAYVRELPSGSRPEVFWASAPDAFEVLSKQNMLTKIGPGNPEIPAKVGEYPVNDPAGFYRGQALAGYGLMWNTRYMDAHKIPKPKEWADLVRPEYFGHVAISSPSRSGTTHLTVETILQGEGWDKGWAQIIAICGNSAAVTERSFGVPDGVSNGQYGIGLVIDFFGLAARNSGMPVEFIYPSVTSIVPANIGLIEGAKNPEAGKRFIEFTLSPEGQALLLEKAISRLPVLPATYAKAPAGYPNPFDGSIKAKVNFNSQLSEERYFAVRSLFDQTITFPHKELVAATKAIHDAQKRLGNGTSPALEEAKKLVFTPVVSAQEIQDPKLLALFSASASGAEVTKEKAAVEEKWATTARANYAKAIQLANSVK